MLNVAITPTSATNALLIEAVIFGTGTAGTTGTVALFQSTAADPNAAIAAVGGHLTGTDVGTSITLKHYMIAGTTSATTFSINCGAASGNFSMNGYTTTARYGGVASSSLTVTEITV
jgi:hypothetical protein